MKLKFLHTADWHLSGTNRIDDFENSIKQIVSFAKQEEVNFILHGSDVFCKRTPDNQARVVFYRFINSIFPIPVIATIGNHDSDLVHSLSPLQSLSVDNLIIYDKLDIQKIDTYFNCDGGNKQLSIGILAIPYLINKPSAEMVSRRVDDLRTSDHDYKIILGHLSIFGAHTDDYEVKDSGFNKEFVLTPEVLDRKGINYIALGHIHKQQEIGNIRYPGSIEHVNFGERKNKVGFYYVQYDIDTEEQEVSFIPLNVRPMVVVDIDSFDNMNKLDSLPKSSVVKINYTDMKISFPLSEIKKKLEEQGHTLQMVNFVREKKTEKFDGITSGSNKTWKDFVTEEIEGSEGYDKEMLKNMFKGYTDESV